MKALFKPILANTFKMKSVWLYWSFALIPFVVMIAMVINSNFLQISGDSGTFSGFKFFSMIYVVLHNLMLPTILLTFIISNLFYNEIDSGTLYMYKDINKTKIMMTKWLVIFLTHAIFISILLLSSIIVYFSFLIQFDFSSGTFLTVAAEFITNAIPLISTYLIDVILINIAIALSLHFSTGWAILGTIMFFLFTTVAPYLEMMKFITPNGYDNMVTKLGAEPVTFIMIGIFLLYFVVLSLYSNYKYKNIEY